MKGIRHNPIRNIVLLVIFGILVLGFTVFLGIYTDYMQLKEVGENFTKIFWTNFNVNTITQLITFVMFFVLILANCIIIRNNLVHIDSSFSYLKRLMPIIAVSGGVALVLSNYARKMVADKFLPFLNSEWFSLGDPIFHQDVGYYIFQRPFYISVLDILLAFGIFLIIFTISSYAVLYARFDFYNMRQIAKEKGIIIHLIASIIIYFLIKAVSYKFTAENVLFKVNKEFVGASYVDIKVWLSYYTIAPILLILVVVVTIIFLLNSKIKPAIITVAVYPASLIIATMVAGAMQTTVVAPNEAAVETPYLQHSIDFTRTAYKLDNVTQNDFKVEYNLTGEKIMNNLGTVNNIRITDFAQTLKVANQLQGIRNYYQFTDADIVPYNLDGKQTAVFVAAREMNKEKLDDSAKNYINQKMKYTHGMGVVMNPVNRITDQGQPYFVIKDVPPRSIEGAPAITQPRIYFGQQADDYVIVNTRDKELDEIETTGYSYEGLAGIKLDFMNRLIYSTALGDFNMLVSDQINSDSKLLLNRNIQQRIKKAAPFLSFDQSATILVDAEGKLKWVIDGYTSSAWFPYSQQSGNFNYIRNPVKAVVDAYDGSVKFYIIDRSDPIIRSYEKIYPTLFEKDEFPTDLASHVRYPETLFKVQAEILKKYHITDPREFYEKRGMWATSMEKYEGDKLREVAPYYSLMKLAGSDKEELVLMLPYTLVNKDNMVAWLAARCSMQNYGQLVEYNFNQNENIYGTSQIENRIDTDPVISQERTLWGQGGSSVIRGNILVIPIENSILYVEPVYISSGKDEAALPEIKRIIVAYNDKVVSKPTLDEGIKALFGVNRPVMVNENDTLESVIQKALQKFDEMKGFSKQNDWENYGKSMKELDDTMQNLKGKTNKIKLTP